MTNIFTTTDEKVVFSQGQNINVSSLKTANYSVVNADFLIGIGTLTSSITVTLPSSPNTGDVYIIKDVNGTCQQFLRDVDGTITIVGYIVTIVPYSGTIDGQANFVMFTPYQSTTVVYTGSQWSVI